MPSALHKDAIVIDGLEVCNWSRTVFEAMHQGGLTAVNCTCVLPYMRLEGTLKGMAQFKTWIEENSDILTPVRSVADIRRAKSEGRVGIILGWQDSTGFDDYLPYIRLFKELGLGIVQITYNTANSVGAGCWETRDGGLTDFGREVLAEMNRVGIAIDLSHVGARTADDAIRASTRPVTYSHISPTALFAHPRNKDDAQLRMIAERGGHIGITMHPPFQRRGNEATLDEYIDSIDHCIKVAGEDHIGIGTDFVQGHTTDSAVWDYLLRDKGYARKLTDISSVVYPAELQGVQDFPNITAKMEARRWPERRIRKVMGENWLRFLGEVWGA